MAHAVTSSRRIQLFLKANADLRDPIYGARFPDGEQWGGIGAAFRDLHWPVTARIRHETLVGLYSLAENEIAIPADVESRQALFGSFPPSLQYSAALFNAKYDAILLSIQADVVASPALHVSTGRRFLLNGERNWPNSDLAWRREAFSGLQLISPEQTMEDLGGVVVRLRQSSDAPILVANMSAVVPGENVHSYLGLPETLSHRIRRFNLALMDFAQAMDISIIDIDRIVAQGGTERLMIDPIHFTFEGCRRIAQETARILEDCGVISAS